MRNIISLVIGVGLQAVYGLALTPDALMCEH
jgi:hypothetical protein